MEPDFFKNSQNASIYKGIGRTRLLNECSESLSLHYTTDSSEIFPFLKSQKEITRSHHIIESLIADQDFTLDFQGRLKKISPFFNISHITETLQTGQVLSYKEINGVALALEQNKHLAKELSPEQIHFFKFDKSESLNFINKILTKVRKFVLEDFQFNLSKDSKLKVLLDSKASQIQKIQKKTSWFLSKYPSIQSSTKDLDFFDGTYLLPIKSSDYESSIGVIEKRSNTGGTFYVSLNCLKNLNDQLKSIQNSIEEYIYIHEKNFSEFYRENLSELTDQFHILEQLDISISKALFCIKYDLTKPQISPNKTWAIDKISHPFIENYIENSFKINRNKDVFLITGSNYGGKSVFLKSVAFCFFLNQSGFFVPAQSASIPFYSKLFYFAGDFQDIEKSESSFSAESKYYKKMLEDIDSHSLVFLDEIFSSTSSLEGSSLAHGLISTITKHFKGAKIFVTTHHELLKEFLSSLDICSFASFSLDPKTGLPNFQLVPDKIENSKAIQTFSRLLESNSFLDEILDEASKVAGISSSPIAINTDDSKALEKKNEELKILRDEFQNLKLDFEIYKNKKTSSSHVLQKNESNKETVQTVKSVEELERSLSNRLSTTVPSPELLAGENYYSHSLQTTVKLIETQKDFAFVLKKSFRMKVPLSDLTKNKNIPIQEKPRPKVTATFELTSEAKTKIDGRGLRLEEFKSEVETQLNHLLTGNIPFIDIVHGHGTGILKNWLLQMIKENPDLTIEKKEDGNDGSTIIKLA